MHTQLKKKKNFSIFYIILVCVDFIYSIYNIIRHLILTEFAAAELFSSLGRTILYLLPLIAFIFISKKVSEIDDVQKCLKIKKYVFIYLISCLVYGFWKYLLNRLCYWNLPIIPSCLFYTSSWMFSLEFLIKYHIFSSIISLIFDICFYVISIMFIKSIGKEIPAEDEFKKGIGKTSTGHKFGIASIVVLSIQTVINILIAGVMHENFSDSNKSFPGPGSSSCNPTFHYWYCKMQFKEGKRSGPKEPSSWKENQYSLPCDYCS